MMDPIKRRIRAFLSGIVRAEVRNELESAMSHAVAHVEKDLSDAARIVGQLLEFHHSSAESRSSYHDHTKDPLRHLALFAGLKDRLLSLGVDVVEQEIDIADFEEWLCGCDVIRKCYDRGETSVEKRLEHYLAYRMLNLSEADVYIDVAAAGSPWAQTLTPKGIRAFRLDLSYERGIHGMDIGADAAETGLPAGFCTAMSFQCAFECLMGDADIRFMKEASRLLTPAGRFVIVPLYLDDIHFVATSPCCDQSKVIIDRGGRRLWRDDPWKVPFSRHYSPEAFLSRPS